ncbi:MAG: GntR family transcriptional regulator [Deltaproteobacteria bacterium]|nr:GntR family transcriptional regulator [Deltaproteobacteria bacterium]
MDPLKIAEDLREKIIWLDLKPGEVLNMVELAETYGVSRNPITIALTRLNAEKWVENKRSHFVVSPLTIDGIRDTAEIRLVLEVQAYIWAMHRLSPAGIDELRDLSDKIASLDDTTTNRAMVELDKRFHRTIYQATQNKALAEFLERILNLYLRFWLSNPNPIKRDRFFEEALTVIEAMGKKDEIAVRTAVTAHIKASLDTIMGFSTL